MSRTFIDELLGYILCDENEVSEWLTNSVIVCKIALEMHAKVQQIKKLESFEKFSDICMHLKLSGMYMLTSCNAEIFKAFHKNVTTLRITKQKNDTSDFIGNEISIVCKLLQSESCGVCK